MAWVLWVVWAVLLFGGFIFGKSDAIYSRRMPTWTRMASSLTLAIAAWVIAAEGQIAGDYALPIAVGMTLGFVGDLLMAGVIGGKQQLIAGMSAFGLGHVAYIIGMMSLGLNDAAAWIGALIVWWGLAGIGWYFSVYRFANGKLDVLHWGALIYSLLLSSTAGATSALALQAGWFLPLAIGGALFPFSDLLIAVRMFGKVHFRLIDDLIWLTYGPAQMLIVYGVLIARMISLTGVP